MNPFPNVVFRARLIPRCSGPLLSPIRRNVLPARFPSASTRRPTTTSIRTAAFNIPPNGIVVPGPPPLPLFERATEAFSPLLRLFYAYGRAQNKRPYTIQLATSVAIYLLGDLNAQVVFREKGQDYDPIRTLRMITIGCILSAPSYKWFLYLSNLFSRFSKPVAVSLRVAINQLFFTPIFLTTFFSLQSFFTGATAEETAEKLQQTLPTAYKNSCQLWLPVSVINFAWIKLEYRSVFSGVVAIGWNAYLSYLNQKAGAVEMVGVDDVVPVAVKTEVLRSREVGGLVAAAKENKMPEPISVPKAEGVEPQSMWELWLMALKGLIGYRSAELAT